MKKANKFWLLLVSPLWVYAAQTYPGYVTGAYGTVVLGAYGDCIHTAYFDKSIDGIDQCDEGRPKQVVVVPAPVVHYEVIKVSDADNILFAFNSARLAPNGEAVLMGMVNKIKDESDVTNVKIVGYTDSIGSVESNLILSKKRADSVKNFFIKQGYEPDKIEANGLGEKDVEVSKKCIANLGQDPIVQMQIIQDKLNSNKFKSKNRKIKAERKQLQATLNKLTQKRATLIKCMAPDRKVVFTIEHQIYQQENSNKLEPSQPMKVDASAATVIPQAI